MLRLTVLAVGAIKEGWLREGLAEYDKRLRPYAKLNVTELADEPLNDDSAPSAERARRLEAERLRRALPADALKIALDIKGRPFSSEQIAALLAEAPLKGRSHLAFIIGGSAGLDESVLKEADKRLSFGPLTLPHRLARLILMEQLYRAMKINRNETYHK